MDFKGMLQLFVPWIVYFTLVEYILRKKLNIKRRKGWIYHRINSVHKNTETALFILYLISYIIILVINEDIAKYMIFLFFVFLFAIRTFMEWKFNHSTREYIISLWAVCSMCVFFVTIIIFL
jgi:hypothetical protein